MIRLASERDVPEILGIYAPYILHSTVTFECTVPTQEEFLERFRKSADAFPWLVWEEKGRILGYACGSLPFTREAFCWCAGASIYLCPDAQRKGIGTRLYRALEECLKAQGYLVIYAVITDENTGSAAFHESLGYTLRAALPKCGYKFRRWVGVLWMEKRLGSPEPPARPPVRWSGFVELNEKFTDVLDKISLF